MRWMLMLVGLVSLSAELAGQSPGSDSLLVSADWLRRHRSESNLVLLHVGHRMDTTMAVELIPGSVEVDYMHITAMAGPIQTELPPIDSVRATLERLGISNDSRVVVYSVDPIMAARAVMTFDAVGHRNVHLLNGGVAAWKAAGGTVTREIDLPGRPGRFVPSPRADVVVDADWIRARIGRSNVTLLDTRTPEEYEGTGTRRGLPSRGHIAGAKLLLWQDLVVAQGSPYFRPVEELRQRLERLGVAPGDTVATYCYVGYRASLSYFVARLLGYDSRIYDGSYDDWARRNYPVVTGTKP